MIKKNLANMLTATRILLALVLLFFINNKVVYLTLFSIAFLTDAIDGTVARLTKSASDFGSKLDDFADTLLGAVMGLSIFIWLGTDLLIFLAFASILIATRIFNVIYTKYKYGKPYVIHTYGNKLTFFIAFLLPITYLLFDSVFFFYVVIAVGTLASIEECIIHITSEKFDHRRKSIFLDYSEEILPEEVKPAVK